MQITDIVVIEKDQKQPEKYMTESVFDIRQRRSLKPKVSHTDIQCTSCDLDHLILPDKHYL